MKKITTGILLFCLSISLFAGNMHYYYGYENRYALSVGTGYDYYKIEKKDTNGNYKPDLTINGMTVNVKVEMPLRSLSGLSLFMDTSFMIPSTSYFNSATNPEALSDSTYLSGLATEDGILNYLLMDNNIGINMLGTINSSLFVYLGGGLDVMIGHSYYEYNDGSLNQTMSTGYIGLGFFQSIGMYYEFTNNIALNVGINISYDLWIYQYLRDSSDSSNNMFEKIDAKGTNYLGKMMLTYNF